MTTVAEPETASEVPLERIEAEICTLAGQIAAATCRFLVLLAAFDAREGWAGWGVRSCAHWLSWRCGIDLVTARQYVRVARALATLPRVREAFAAGRVSYSKVRALVRVATPQNESDLVEAALSSSAAQLERLVGGLHRATRGDKSVAHSFRWRWDEDGSLVIWGRLAPEDGAAVLAALDAADAALDSTRDGVEPADGSPGDSAESPEARPDLVRPRRGLQALAAMSRAALAGLPRIAGPHGDAPVGEVVVHVDVDLLTRLRAPSGHPGENCAVEDGPGLTIAVVEQLACDARIRLSVDGPDGRTLDLGRRRRRPSGRMFRALWRRDRGCAVPGCGRTRFLHAHHIRHWALGGPTSLDNLVLLCSEHHRLVHAGGLTVAVAGAQRFVFLRHAGTSAGIGSALRLEVAPRQAGDAASLAAAAPSVGPESLTPDGYVPGVDLGWAVTSYLTAWEQEEQARRHARREETRG